MTSADRPDVSVLIAAWNAEATIAAALDCALGQDGPRVEVIAVDDASTDGTVDVLHAAAARDPRVTVLVQPANRGPAAARNRALAHARAPFVTILDADDTMAPDRLARLTAIADAGSWDIVADDLWKVEPGQPRSAARRLWSADPIGTVELDFAGFVTGNLSRLSAERGELGFLKPLMRRDMLRLHRLTYREDMRLGEDYALYAAALASGARACLTDPCGYYALVRPGSLSGRHDAAALRGLAEADHWLATLPNLAPTDRTALRAHDRETQERWRWMRLIEAVKRRDAVEAARCFGGAPAVSLALLGRLAEQARLRTARRFVDWRARGATGGPS